MDKVNFDWRYSGDDAAGAPRMALTASAGEGVDALSCECFGLAAAAAPETPELPLGALWRLTGRGVIAGADNEGSLSQVKSNAEYLAAECVRGGLAKHRAALDALAGGIKLRAAQANALSREFHESELLGLFGEQAAAPGAPGAGLYGLDALAAAVESGRHV